MAQDLEQLDFDKLTARGLICDKRLSVSVACARCRCSRTLNPWKIGDRLGDTALRHLKFVCDRCRGRATTLEVWANHVGTSRIVATIVLERPKAAYGSGLWVDP